MAEEACGSREEGSVEIELIKGNFFFLEDQIWTTERDQPGGHIKEDLAQQSFLLR